MTVLITWEIALYIGFAVLAHVLVYMFVTRKRPRSIVDKHVVVTGGSKGIGLCLAVECALKGANVTVIARDEKMLSKFLHVFKRNIPDLIFIILVW